MIDVAGKLISNSPACKVCRPEETVRLDRSESWPGFYVNRAEEPTNSPSPQNHWTMKFRFSHRLPFFHPQLNQQRLRQRCFFTSLLKKVQSTSPARASFSNGGGGDSKGNMFLVPGATAATLLMLGALHARRMYDDKKVEEAREKGVEIEFQPDAKASFLAMLPLRSISRFWGSLTSVELPIWMRPHVYKAWARAFHSNLEEISLPLEEYSSLREFFVRTLKEGSRPIDADPHSLVTGNKLLFVASPVDGTILRFGELKGRGAMIEQVKGFSYSASSLLGASSFLPMVAEGDVHEEGSEDQSNNHDESSQNSQWRISLSYPKAKDRVRASPRKGLYYCVIYLRPGDYHRIHSPVDWNILVRRHFSGRLYPVNERATRTIRNLYVENERVVVEGLWNQGFMAMAAVGATNIGSIELLIEPELRTNRPKQLPSGSEPPDERFYDPEGVGRLVKKGDEIAAFNMGSTVVLVFQAPALKPAKDGDRSSSEFRFNIKRGDRVRVGEALGRLTGIFEGAMCTLEEPSSTLY
ncbi:Phosphatidylserine decarboxylase proenzyme 1, mitochondrial [Linum perenne]